MIYYIALLLLSDDDITNNACTTPGMYPRKVRSTFIRRSIPHPVARKTAIGGKMIASMISITKEKVPM